MTRIEQLEAELARERERLKPARITVAEKEQIIEAVKTIEIIARILGFKVTDYGMHHRLTAIDKINAKLCSDGEDVS